MRVNALVLALALLACTRERVVVVYRDLEPEQPTRVTAVDMALADVDARGSSSPEPFAPAGSPTPIPLSNGRERVSSEPARAIEPEPATERRSAVEADVDGARAYVVAAGKPPPR